MRPFSFVMILGLAALRPAAGLAEPDSRPNVLFIAIDDLRDWVTCFGRNPQSLTPHFDRLAAKGTAFTRAYCAAPVCNPSRTALMSGLRPSSTGVYDNENDWRTVIPPDMMLPSAFRRAGYFVCGAGKIYHESFKRPANWDDYLDTPHTDPQPGPGQDTGVGSIRFAPVDCRDDELADWKITDHAIEELGRRHDKPLFLAVGLHKPHMPWYVPRAYYDKFPLDGVALPPHLADDLDDVPEAGKKMVGLEGHHARMLESGRWREAVQGYLAAIAYLDMNLGRLLDALERSPERDRTIVCLWSDHGWHLGEKNHWRKFTLWEEATRSPLVWIVPGLTKPGSVCERPIDFMTIYPTLMDLCGLPKPAHVQGTSIRPLLADPAAEWAEPAIMTHKFRNHAVRTADWRYIRYANGDEELYDERQDPNEWVNLATRPEHAAVKTSLTALLPTDDHPDIGKSVTPPAGLARSSVTTTPITTLAPQAGCDRHDPSNVVRWHDRYWVFYTHNVDDHRVVSIHLACSEDGLHWDDLGPALEGGSSGAWDESGVIAPYVVIHDDTFHLYYTGFHAENLATRDLGLATADSPHGPWSRSPDNPLLRRALRAADWDSGMLGDSNVVHRDGRWWLYYKSRRAGETNRETRIGVATADSPTGPFHRHPENPLFCGHAFTVWPCVGGVAAVGGVASSQLLWAADGIHFEPVGKLVTESTGLFTPDAGADIDPPHLWGLEVHSEEVDGRPSRGLRRFDWHFAR
jgi:arylsulfatase A-like enzyme